jgi:hypothetical protein
MSTLTAKEDRDELIGIGVLLAHLGHREQDEKLRRVAGRLLSREQDAQELLEVLKEASSDLECFVAETYEGMHNYPSMENRYQRDIAIVIQARAAIAHYEGLKEKEQLCSPR